MYSECEFRKCGNGWHYCNGNCDDCSLNKYSTSNTTTETNIIYTSNMTIENGGNKNV